MRWNSATPNQAELARFAARLGLTLPAAACLWRLGLHTREAAENFLEPRLRQIDNPFAITNLDKAVHRLRQAMAREEKILVFGDYDVDGVTSTAFLISVLNVFAVYPRYIVPRRLAEGYGLTISALERALEGGIPQLLIAVDCGTNSREEVAFLKQRGVDVIIIDHHVSKSGIPDDCIVVNPHVFDGEDKPWSHLCTVGLIFKFVHGLLKQLREEGDELAQQIQIKDYLDFVALGTVADMVPLQGENRILAKNGLRKLRETQRPGLNALFEVSKIKLGEEVSPWDIAFRLGPRINASGRLADASVPIAMLLSQNFQQCLDTARLLDDFNRERQDIEKNIVQAATEMVEGGLQSHAGFVLYHPEWHPGVVGIVASRISMKYHRPTLVLGAENGLAKGSGRSVAGINLVQALMPCANLLAHWGGHPMAVGVSCHPNCLPELREAFSESILQQVQGKMPKPVLDITYWVEPRDLCPRLLEELDRLSPFGQGNPEPVFGISRVVLKQPPKVFGQGNYRFPLDNGNGTLISIIGWKKTDDIPPANQPLDLALKPGWNIWNDKKYLQASLVAWRPSMCP